MTKAYTMLDTDLACLVDINDCGNTALRFVNHVWHQLRSEYCDLKGISAATLHSVRRGPTCPEYEEAWETLKRDLIILTPAGQLFGLLDHGSLYAWELLGEDFDQARARLVDMASNVIRFDFRKGRA